jgi:hypothetical protein
MISTLAYEIGAVFLLAALLMYGTANGFVPRSLRVGKTFPILLAAGALAFAIYRLGPDLYAGWLSAVAMAPSLTPSRTTTAAPMPATAPAKSTAPPPRASKQPAANSKTLVIVESVPATGDPAAPPSGTPAQDAAAKTTAATDSKPAAKSSDSSPYDSGVKRAVKSVGRFLHVGRKKEQ